MKPKWRRSDIRRSTKNSDTPPGNALFVAHCQFYVDCLYKKDTKSIEVHNFATYYVWKDVIFHVVSEAVRTDEGIRAGEDLFKRRFKFVHRD